MNSQIDVMNGRSYPFELSFGTGFLVYFSAETLEKLKWIMTFVFSLLFCGMGYFTLRWFLPGKNNYQLLIFVYVLVFGIAAFIYLSGGMMDGWKETAFSQSRNLLHALQSPLIIMILIPVILLRDHSNTGNSRSK